jgi:hypothetical protein
MLRSAVPVTVAVLVVVPVFGFAQQESPDARNTARTVPEVRTRQAPVAGARSSPESVTVREGIATAIDMVVALPKAIPAPPVGSWGIVSEGTGGGGMFRDSDSDAEAWLGANSTGVTGYGSISGGFFQNSDGSGLARLGWGDWGLAAGGDYTGAYIADADGSGYSWIGYDRPSGSDKGGAANAGEYGVYAGGSKAGGYFENSSGTGYAYLGNFGFGIAAYGPNLAAGYFEGLSGQAYVAWFDTGIHAEGEFSGGSFEHSGGTGFAYAAYDRPSGNDKGGNANQGEYGVYAAGAKAGAYFEDDDNVGYAYIGYGNQGIKAWGSSTGGYFEDTDGTGYAYVGRDNYGIDASGSDAAGHFVNNYGGYSSEARIANGYSGVSADGTLQGGFFTDNTSDGYSRVAYGTYKIYGNGTVNFVQNHPYDRDSVIVYAAPEGDEAATYTRGTARLVDGEATVPLGETFRWVTNPDVGLTAHLTPREDPVPLAVVKLSTEQMVVRGPGDAPDGLVFDYLVYGLRIGFEETSVVQEKQHEAYIPSMSDHRELYQRRPDLRKYNPLERFKGMRDAVGTTDELDLGGADALREAIVEFDPAVHELSRPAGSEGMADPEAALRNEGNRGDAQTRDASGTARPRHGRRPAPDHQAIASRIPMDDDGNVYATSFRPSAREVASLVEVSEAVEPGDVMVIDREDPGMMRRGFEAHDTGVVGVVAADAGVVLGADSSMSDGSADGFPPRAAVALGGVVGCKADAGYGAIWPGDLLVTSPTPGHAMRTDAPLPGTMVGKALEPLAEGTGTIRVLVMLR